MKSTEPVPARIVVDPSQFPESIRLELLESLRTRKVNHKFHYASARQTQKWLALHQAYSPARIDPDCLAIYQQSFASVIPRLRFDAAHVVGLCCGGGQKDSALLRRLIDSGKRAFYTPCDASVAMVLVARQAALHVLPGPHCLPLVCDVATASAFAGSLEAISLPGATPTDQVPRFFTFFGTLHNFEPQIILPKLAEMIRPGSYLLLGANLAPETDYASALQRVLPFYDNELTRDWLTIFLVDLGIEKSDGELVFAVEEGPAAPGLKRIAADFYFHRDRELTLDSERFEFRAGEPMRLFFSYRHQPSVLRSLLRGHGLEVLDQWVAPSGEEGVFLVRNSE